MDCNNPSHIVVSLDGVTFSSDFDNGNLCKVALVEKSEYNLWTSPDNMGTEYQSKHCSWFYFSISGAAPNTLLKLNLINCGSHTGIYKYDMRPVFKSFSTNHKWIRIKNALKTRKSEGKTYVSIEHTVDSKDDKIYFAFTYPYSYSNLQEDLDAVNSHINDFSSPDNIIYFRELLAHSVEGRRVELITITNANGASKECEPLLPNLFPEYLKSSLVKRPPIFLEKEVIFISARVHAGEVPSQHTWKGMFSFLLDPNDQCAKELRKRYVIKMIPMLNPDGVFRGHFRMDSLGQNLNRYYTEPTIESQPSIVAAKTLLDYYANENLLTLYLDLHAHASKRGCFIYGNVMDDMQSQVQNQLFCKLIALNTPHFDYEGCLFSKEHMSRIDPGDAASGLTAEGSGRVATYLSHGLIHSYTLECNYNTSRTLNEVPPCDVDPGGRYSTPASAFSANPDKYTPFSYASVGRACLIAILDIRGHNPCSRLPKSKYKSLDRLQQTVVVEVRSRKEYRLLSKKPLYPGKSPSPFACQSTANVDSMSSTPRETSPGLAAQSWKRVALKAGSQDTSPCTESTLPSLPAAAMTMQTPSKYLGSAALNSSPAAVYSINGIRWDPSSTESGAHRSANSSANSTPVKKISNIPRLSPSSNDNELHVVGPPVTGIKNELRTSHRRKLSGRQLQAAGFAYLLEHVDRNKVQVPSTLVPGSEKERKSSPTVTILVPSSNNHLPIPPSSVLNNNQSQSELDSQIRKTRDERFKSREMNISSLASMTMSPSKASNCGIAALARTGSSSTFDSIPAIPPSSPAKSHSLYPDSPMKVHNESNELISLVPSSSLHRLKITNSVPNSSRISSSAREHSEPVWNVEESQSAKDPLVKLQRMHSSSS